MRVVKKRRFAKVKSRKYMFYLMQKNRKDRKVLAVENPANNLFTVAGLVFKTSNGLDFIVKG